MATFQVTFVVDDTSQHLIATPAEGGDGTVENGLTMSSQNISVTDASVDLGTAAQGVFAFTFTLNSGDTSSALVAIASDLSLTIVDMTGMTGTIGPMPNEGVLDKFWNGITPDITNAALSGALEDWIVSNAVGLPVLVVVGFVSFGTGFLLGALASVSDFVGIFVEQVAAAEVAQGILTDAEANEIKSWANVTNAALQLPAVLTSESALVRVAGVVATDVNFTSESQVAKIGVTFASDGVAKYVLALSALKK